MAIAGLGVLGAMVLPATVSDSGAAPAARTKAGTAHVAGNGQVAAASAAKATASPASHPKGHYNVGNPHSPRLEHELAGPAGTSGPVINSPMAAATAGPVNGAAQGVDVASFQHPGPAYPNGAPIDWQQVASAGIKFAAVKVTEGAYYTNPYAASDLAKAQAAGLSTIGYAFAIPNGGFDSNGNQLPAGSQAQADYLLSNLPTDIPAPPIMLDIEYDPYAGTGPDKDGTTGVCYGLGPGAMKNWIAGFDAEIQAKTGWLPIIYTTQDWWSMCTGGSTAFGQNPAWPADYSNSSPALPAGWGTWNLWQYTSKGTVKGIQTTGATDLDQANPALITLLNGGLKQTAPNRSANAGSTIGRQFKASDSSGQAPAFTATGLPPGLSISGNGLVSGWPDTPGSYHPVVTATESAGGSGSASFTWTINPAPTIGPTGAVRLGTGGKCLEDYRYRTRNGNPIITRACNGTAQQNWTLVQDNTMRIRGKCLTLSSGHGVLEACNGSAAQRWRVGTGGELVNASTGKCLAGSATANSAQTWTGGCTPPATNKQWKLVGGPVLAGIAGKCLDDNRNATTVGNKIVTAACNGSAEQNWLVKPDGSIRIHSMCLDVAGGAAVLNSCKGSAGQQWQIPAAGSGSALVNPASGQCLADPNDSTTNGTQAGLGTCPSAAGPVDPGVTWRVR